MFKLMVAHHGKLISTLVALVIFASLPLFIQSPYHLHILILVVMNAILAMTFVLLLRTGLINMAIAVFWGLGAYSSAALVMQLHLSFWLALPCSAIIAGVLALILGAFLIRGAGFSFVIMTIVIGMLFPTIIGSTGIFGGWAGIQNVPRVNPLRIPLLPPIEFNSNVPYFYLILFLLAIVLAVYSILYMRWTGRAWRAIGLNSHLAESIGINAFRYRLLAFVVASATAGLMGSFWAHYQCSLLPDSFGIFKTVSVQVYAILGGMDFAILGPLVGSFIMVLFPELMRVAREIEPIITGALLIVLVTLLPGGILSLPGLRALAATPAQSIAKIGKTIKSLSSRQGARKV